MGGSRMPTGHSGTGGCLCRGLDPQRAAPRARTPCYARSNPHKMGEQGRRGRLLGPLVGPAFLPAMKAKNLADRNVCPTMDGILRRDILKPGRCSSRAELPGWTTAAKGRSRSSESRRGPRDVSSAARNLALFLVFCLVDLGGLAPLVHGRLHPLPGHGTAPCGDGWRTHRSSAILGDPAPFSQLKGTQQCLVCLWASLTLEHRSPSGIVARPPLVAEHGFAPRSIRPPGQGQRAAAARGPPLDRCPPC